MRVTASKSGLLQLCQYWAREEVPWVDAYPSDDASFGTEVHACCEALVESRPLPAIAEHATRVVAHAQAWIAEHRKPFWLAEVAFAWDPLTDTGKQLEKSGHREYTGRLPGEMSGTADVVWLEGEVAHVLDWKTGFDVEYARPQLRTLGLFVARAWGVSQVVTHMVKLSETGVDEQLEIIDEFELAVIAGELAGLLAGVRSSEPQAGMHCTNLYCPAQQGCPATREALAQVVPAEALVRHKMDLAIDTVDKASWLLPRLRLLESFVDSAKECLKIFARANGGIPVGDGKVWSEGQSSRTQFDKAKAVALCTQLGATQAQLDALSYKMVHNEFRERRAR